MTADYSAALQDDDNGKDGEYKDDRYQQGGTAVFPIGGFQTFMLGL